MRRSLTLRTLTLAIGLSAFSLSGHAAIQFNCSDSLTREAGDALVMRCSGVLDIRGDGASDPDSLLSNANGIRLHGELGLSLDGLTLVAPSIDLTVGQGPLQLGQDLVVRAPGGVFVGVPRVQVGRDDTRQEVVLSPIGGGLVISDGSDIGDVSLTPGFVVRDASVGQVGGSVVVGGGNIDLTDNNAPLPAPQVGQVPEPGTWALALIGLGALSLRPRRRG